MTDFRILYPRLGWQEKMSFEQFITLTKGCMIKSFASADSFFEIGVSDNMNIRFECLNSKDVLVSVFSTLNEDEFPEIRVNLIADDEEPLAELVERRISLFRSIFASLLLANNDEEDNDMGGAYREKILDRKEDIFPKQDRLYISNAGEGSFWIGVIAKSRKAYTAVVQLASLAYPEGRDALLRRVRADTEMKEIAVEEKIVDLDIKKANGLVDLLIKIDKIKDPATRSRAQEAAVEQIRALHAEDQDRLGPPSNLTAF